MAQERNWTPNISLGLYRRISALASDAETEAMAAELTDRFGPLPEEVENLLQVVALKRACREAGVEKLDAGPKGMVIGFRGNAFANPAGLVNWLAGKGENSAARCDCVPTTSSRSCATWTWQRGCAVRARSWPASPASSGRRRRHEGVSGGRSRRNMVVLLLCDTSSEPSVWPSVPRLNHFRYGARFAKVIRTGLS